MSIIEIDSTKIFFDRAKTQSYQLEKSQSCECQGCKNYYENLKNKHELINFLSAFGIDCFSAEEVLDSSAGDTLIHYEVYYGIAGYMDRDEAVLRDFGVKLSFRKSVNLLHDIPENFLWIVVENDFPFVLNEERDI